jgi:hypothetical protein
MDYIFANFGEAVFVGGKKGKITEFDDRVGAILNTKVMFSNGSFLWVNRDELEGEMRDRESFLMSLHNHATQKHA